MILRWRGSTYLGTRNRDCTADTQSSPEEYCFKDEVLQFRDDIHAARPVDELLRQLTTRKAARTEVSERGTGLRKPN